MTPRRNATAVGKKSLEARPQRADQRIELSGHGQQPDQITEGRGREGAFAVLPRVPRDRSWPGPDYDDVIAVSPGEPDASRQGVERQAGGRAPTEAVSPLGEGKTGGAKTVIIGYRAGERLGGHRTPRAGTPDHVVRHFQHVLHRRQTRRVPVHVRRYVRQRSQLHSRPPSCSSRTECRGRCTRGAIRCPAVAPMMGIRGSPLGARSNIARNGRGYRRSGATTSRPGLARETRRDREEELASAAGYHRRYGRSLRRHTGTHAP